jgi:hypothetical protein
MLLFALAPDTGRRCWIDLRPYINAHINTVLTDAPIARAYRLFRTLGLRQLVVVSTAALSSLLGSPPCSGLLAIARLLNISLRLLRWVPLSLCTGGRVQRCYGGDF